MVTTVSRITRDELKQKIDRATDSFCWMRSGRAVQEGAFAGRFEFAGGNRARRSAKSLAG